MTLPNPSPKVKSETIDGTEYRDVVLRIKEGGINVLLNALTANSDRSFLKGWIPRAEILDDGQIMISISSNTGTIDEYVFLGLDLFITLKPEELKMFGITQNAPSP